MKPATWRLLMLLVRTVSTMMLLPTDISATSCPTCQESSPCIRAANNFSIPFEDLGRGPERFPSGVQIIIDSYRFQCCGRILSWGTYVEPGGGMEDGDYNIDFQVWRPNGTERCYKLVSNNSFSSIILGTGGLVCESAQLEEEIRVQPGDVVGLYVEHREGGDRGIQKDDTISGESVWYQKIPKPSGGDLCVGQESGRILQTFSNNAPILSVTIRNETCDSANDLVSPVIETTTLPPPPISAEETGGQERTTAREAEIEAPVTAVIIRLSSKLTVGESLGIAGGSIVLMVITAVVTAIVTVCVSRKLKSEKVPVSSQSPSDKTSSLIYNTAYHRFTLSPMMINNSSGISNSATQLDSLTSVSPSRYVQPEKTVPRPSLLSSSHTLPLQQSDGADYSNLTSNSSLLVEPYAVRSASGSFKSLERELESEMAQQKDRRYINTTPNMAYNVHTTSTVK